ncbi:hypothetical protein MKZ38_010207 [Zalerion maritima]|uniref:DNA replication checkpoint mediator MRC1 domain-containing protein n=1 Tax=Zalerion maritima TaxID=339359 RepID=A0AAD5RSK7_9PEZI|nr:hypothetical protein MKZ38_010207 [Zalerion maritima]
MSVSRSSSPSGSEIDEHFRVSPRTKLKRALAAIDASSDEDESQTPVKKQKKPTTTPEDEDEEVVARPRGRLASRMEGGDSPDAPNAPIPTTEQDTNNVSEGAVEDQDVITAPRRLKQRQLGRSKTPKATAATAEPDTPGLFVSPEKRAPRQNSDLESDDDELPSLKSGKLAALVARKRKEREAKKAEEEKKRQEREQRIVSEMDLDSASDDPSDITDDDGGRQLTQKARPTRKASKRAIEEMNRETQRMDRSRQLAHHCQTKKKVTKNALFDRFNFMTGPPIPEGKPASLEKVLARSSRPSSPTSHHSDANARDSSTPPTSPPKEGEKPSEAAPAEKLQRRGLVIPDMDNDLPTIDEFMSKPKEDSKSNSKAPRVEVGLNAPEKPRETRPTAPRVRVKLPANLQVSMIALDDDDDDGDDLVVMEPKALSKFDQQVARISKRKQKAGPQDPVFSKLAQAVSPGKERGRRRKQKGTMTKGQLQYNLMQRVREQAKLERDRRIDILKAKGVVIETEEERLKLEEQVDDIVARARQEAEEISQRERAAARKERKEAGGADDPLALDDSDDESYQASDEEQEMKEVELSGSEDDEEEDDAEEAEGSDEEMAGNPLFDDAANEEDDSAEDEPEKEDDDAVPAAKSRRSRNVHVVSDDEDESDGMDVVKATPKPKATPFKVPNTSASRGKTPTSVLRSATKPFIPGLPIPVAAPAGLGLTQMFQGTMDSESNCQSQPFPAGELVSTAPMPSVNQFPFNSQTHTQDDFVADSQGPSDSQAQGESEEVSQPVEFNLKQTQTHGFDSIWTEEMTQMHAMDVDMDMDIPTPTQDGGFVKFTPLKTRFADTPATMATQPFDGEDVQSPLFRRKGKLRRRNETANAPALVVGSDDEDNIPETAPLRGEENEFAAATGVSTAAVSTTAKDKDTSAFEEMCTAARKAKKLAAYNRKKSKAKEMFHEQAEESEDEYAGLGGVDGEDSSDNDGELDEEVKAMIDDQAGSLNEVDERRLAAFHAGREREADEKQVDKLFKDITTGQLRKRRKGGIGGGEYGLDDDSDDDGALEAQRRVKRRQFQKMQREMFKDERVKKVAENPRNLAFLRSIETAGMDGDEGDFLEFVNQRSQQREESQSQSQSQGEGEGNVVPDSQPKGRPTLDQGSAGNPRRTKEHLAKPRDMNAIRDSLSDLLDDPHAVAPASVEDEHASGSEGEDDEDAQTRPTGSDKENARPVWTKPTVSSANPRRAKGGVVDRISLSRQSSTSSNGSGSGPGGRLAFAAPASTMGGFKGVPALLRRATTNSSLLSTAQSSTSHSTSSSTNDSNNSGPNTPREGKNPKQNQTSGGFGEDAKIKRNAGKLSGVNYFARETERRARLEERESKRLQKKVKGAAQRRERAAAAGGLFGGGSFE